MVDRNRVFQRLKPPCVALSQAALALNGPAANIHIITERLEALKHELAETCTASSALDENLADYVFYPLSQVLRASQKVSIRCVELSLQCLAILIEQGWRSRIQAPMAIQIIILCTMMAEKSPSALASTETTAELQASALRCLFCLFNSLEPAVNTKSALASDVNFPQLGQTISVVLDAIVDANSVEVQIAATEALLSLIRNVASRDVEASFLPGIVSKLTKVLTPQTTQRRNHAVLVACLDALQALFSDTLGEVTPDFQLAGVKRNLSEESPPVIDEKWLQHAATQLKPAIASILKLRSHSRYDVREALARLCFVILKQCRQSLANCGSLALETVLLLCSDEANDAIKFRLETFLQGDASVSTLVQSTIYDWLRSMPTTMQGADDRAKSDRLRQITTAYSIAVSGGLNLTAIDRMLANVLRDSVVITIQVPRSDTRKAAAVPPVQSLDLAVLDRQNETTVFSSPLVEYKAQQDPIEGIKMAAKAVIKSSSTSSIFAADLARSLRQSHGDVQLASFWLLLETVEAALSESQVDAYLDFGDERSSPYREYLEDIYAFSLSILTDTLDEPVDIRLQSLALRTLALRAQFTGEEFQFELNDTLYPVLHTLSTPYDHLQQDSIAALNVYTKACGYGSVKDLIVENVDYLTNAVALKLNAFDVSPQAPQVLLMMVRLAGPSLLPYLEDTIESIFAALRDYHGYPLLVELLFKVLGVVAEEGAKAPQLAIADGRSDDLLAIRKESWEPVTVNELSEILKERHTHQLEELSQARTEEYPRRPWKDTGMTEDGFKDDASEDRDRLADEVEPVPPAPKAYGLLLRISEQTQHFLPSASASLRLSLMELIKTTIPAIARHENSFLPLINTLWPEIVSRIDDAESNVVAGALDIVALLCQYAGDFMRSRMMQLWPGLIEVYHRTARDIMQSMHSKAISRSALTEKSSQDIVPTDPHLQKAIARMKSVPADYSDTSTRLVWASFVHAITAAVQYVRLSPDLYDEALEMLDPVLEQPEVRGAFEIENANAVWLSRVRNGTLTTPEMPTFPEHASWNFIAAIG